MIKRIRIDLERARGRLSISWDRQADRLDVVNYFVGMGVIYDGDGWFFDTPRARAVVPLDEILEIKTGPM